MRIRKRTVIVGGATKEPVVGNKPGVLQKKKKDIRLLEQSLGRAREGSVSISAPNLILFGKQIAADVMRDLKMRPHWLQGASCI